MEASEADGLCRVGAAHLERDEFEAAYGAFTRAAQLDPKNSTALLGLAQAHRNLWRWPEAEREARAALAANPQSATIAHYLAVLIFEQDRTFEALPFFEQAQELAPNVAQIHRDLGVTLLFAGELTRGRVHLFKSLEFDDRQADVLLTLLRSSDMADGSTASERLLTHTEDLASRPLNLTDDARAQLWFGLGKAYEDQGRTKDAAAALARANALKRATLTYNIGWAEAHLRAVADVFEAGLMSRLAGAGLGSDRPTFIVGLPRSGSTLVEQMLSAHPEVQGGGELSAMPNFLAAMTGLAGARFPEWARTMTPADCALAAQDYLARLPPALPGRRRTTDKWLENFAHLGLIALCLPNAKVIHCHRDPRDQLFSCWSTFFVEQQMWTYDVGELRRYYAAYAALMEHWRRVLPAGFVLDVRYEDLVAQPEATARRMLEHCDLEWDDVVLRFWEVKRAVKSASLTQVREPIYDRSIGRWRNFASAMPDLLGDDVWV